MIRAMRTWWSLVAISLWASTAALGYDFSRADGLYDQRAGNPTKIAEARAAYTESVSQVQADELIYAVSQIARLDYYLGEILTSKDDKETRKTIFGNCLDAMDAIAPHAVGPNPAYYNYKISCLALWGEAAGTGASLPRVGELKGYISNGLSQDQRFEGGGIGRTIAAIYINEKGKPLGLYNPEEALRLIDQSLMQTPYPGRHYPDPLAGTDFYENYYYKAKTLLELGRADEARTVIQGAVEEIEALIAENLLPRRREPETMFFYEKMKNFFTEVN